MWTPICPGNSHVLVLQIGAKGISDLLLHRWSTRPCISAKCSPQSSHSHFARFAGTCERACGSGEVQGGTDGNDTPRRFAAYWPSMENSEMTGEGEEAGEVVPSIITIFGHMYIRNLVCQSNFTTRHPQDPVHIIYIIHTVKRAEFPNLDYL